MEADNQPHVSQSEPLRDFLAGLRDGEGRWSELNVRHAAAYLGPGLRGKKAVFSADERSFAVGEVSKAWAEAGLGPAPLFLADEPHYVERRAKLFEVGEYDDKSLSVEAADLQRLAKAFDFPAPVLVEHTENPLRLGYLTDVEAAGGELFGTLALTPEADGLLEKSQAKSLSVSVSKGLDRIFEVSIVANPRIQSARLFCENFHAEPANTWKAEAASLRRQLEERERESAIGDLIRSGRIAPAARESAEALLAAARSGGFSAELLRFLHELPKAVHFGEMVPAVRRPGAEASDEEAAFYSRFFPNVAIEEIMKRKVK